MKVTNQFGSWAPGENIAIPQMLDICLEGMKHHGIQLPKDSFGNISFKITYKSLLPCSEDDPTSFHEEASKEGYTAIKVEYEEEVAEGSEPSSPA